jgi:uncharacterized protein with LGFP repeats
MNTKSILSISFFFCFVLSSIISFASEDPINQKYKKLNAEKGILGKALTVEHGIASNGGLYQRYENGSIYWHPSTGAFEVHGDIFKKWEILNWEQGFLGYPLSDELWTPNHSGRFQKFQGGNIYWDNSGEAFEVHGAILAKYGEFKYEQGFIGYPLSDEQDPGDGKGRYQRFENASIYWTAKEGAYEVHGDIFEKWGDYNWEHGFLGYPITDEVDPGDGVGRFQKFEGGSIYWTAETGAHEVHGEIYKKWDIMEWEKGILGYPKADELWTPDRSGKFQQFQYGNIYWNNGEEAFEVHGDILKKYGNYNYEQGFLGYPLSDELEAGAKNGKFQRFEGGSIYWTRNTGAHEVHGDIFKKWEEENWEQGKLGYPISDQLDLPNGEGKYSKFEHGRIEWNANDGAKIIMNSVLDAFKKKK